MSAKAATTKRRPAVCWDITGPGGSGKTDLAMQAPGDIHLFPFDPRSLEIADKYHAAGKVVVLPPGGRYTYTDTTLKVPGPVTYDVEPETPYRLRFTGADMSNEEVKKAAIPVWLRFCADLRVAMRKRPCSVVVDSATDAWKVLCQSRYGRTSSILPVFYGQLNFEFTSALREAWDDAGGQTNLMLCHQTADEYKGTGRVDPKGEEIRSKTGRLVRDGCKKMEFLLGSEIRTEFRPASKADGVEAAFTARFGVCKTNMVATGEELELPWVTPGPGVGAAWQMLAAFARPDVEPEVWDEA